MKANSKKLELVDKNIAPSTIAGTIQEVVKGCFDKDGEYKKYMKDYSILAYSLALFTNWEGESDFDTVMAMYFDGSFERLMMYNDSNPVAQKYFYMKESVEEEISRQLSVNSKLYKFVEEATKFVGYLNVVSETTSKEAVKAFVQKIESEKSASDGDNNESKQA